MKNRCVVCVCLLLLSFSVYSQEKDLRTFMFVGEPSAKAWQYLIDSPADRKSEVSAAFKQLGGEVISYYFGLGNGKNYIIVTIPNDNELIQAIYLMRLPTGLLNAYEMIELMPSDQMSAALKKSKELINADKTVKK